MMRGAVWYISSTICLEWIIQGCWMEPKEFNKVTKKYINTKNRHFEVIII